MRLRVRSLPLLSGLRIWRCRELWCRLQTQLGSHVAVSVMQDGSCSSNSTPSLGTSICHRCSPKKFKKKKKSNDQVPMWHSGLRIQSCHSCCRGHNCGVGSTYYRHGQINKIKKNRSFHHG